MKGAPRGKGLWWEVFGLLALAGLTYLALATSWRKWPDPLIDFGRELYIPWRLSNGALLYRDVDDFYGPFSQYFNAGLFKLFGPGLMVLVTANLLIFGAILALIYVLFRRAWGAGPALASSACFVSVFSFSQFVVGSYNYAAPYAHEATHGMLLCLLLVLALLRWLDKATMTGSATIGGLLGIAAVLKPEIAFSAGLVTAAALVEKGRKAKPVLTKESLVGAIFALLPTAAFAAYFSVYEPWRTALGMACRAWLSVVWSTRYIGDVVQTGFLGLDAPWPNLLLHLEATVAALIIIGGLAGAAWISGRLSRPSIRWPLGLAALALVTWLAVFKVSWINVGRCLLGLALIYAIVRAARLFFSSLPAKDPKREAARLLIAVLAVGMTARMLLNGRIYQFGFYQAALAGILVPAVVLGEIPEHLPSRWARTLAVIGGILLIAPGVFMLAGSSQRILRLRTLAIGAGVDRFYAFPPDIEPTGQIIGQISEKLSRTPAEQTVLVLPEGEMINYLSRRASPVAPFFFFSAATSGGREQAIVESLRKNPPDWVVIVSRDLREYGVTRYGESVGEGKSIMQWVDANYRFYANIGGDPLLSDQRGGVILRRR